MKRRISLSLAFMSIAVLLAGCVVRPFHGDGGGYGYEHNGGSGFSHNGN